MVLFSDRNGCTWISIVSVVGSVDRRVRGLLMPFGSVSYEFFIGWLCFSAFLGSFGWSSVILFRGFSISPLFVCLYVEWLMDVHLLLRIFCCVYLFIFSFLIVDEYVLIGLMQDR